MCAIKLYANTYVGMPYSRTSTYWYFLKMLSAFRQSSLYATRQNTAHALYHIFRNGAVKGVYCVMLVVGNIVCSDHGKR